MIAIWSVFWWRKGRLGRILGSINLMMLLKVLLYFSKGQVIIHDLISYPIYLFSFKWQPFSMAHYQTFFSFLVNSFTALVRFSVRLATWLCFNHLVKPSNRFLLKTQQCQLWSEQNFAFIHMGSNMLDRLWILFSIVTEIWYLSLKGILWFLLCFIFKHFTENNHRFCFVLFCFVFISKRIGLAYFS